MWKTRILSCMILVACTPNTTARSNAPACLASAPVLLADKDLEHFRQEAMRHVPELGPSPEIRAASAQRSVRSTEIATIIFEPHSQKANVKKALQLHCARVAENGTWVCRQAEFRRYVRLKTQDFEVRVRGNISTESAVTLISASRQFKEGLPQIGSHPSDTAIMIFPSGGAYFVTWGSAAGAQHTTIRAEPAKRANSEQLEDWQFSLFQPDPIGPLPEC